MTPLAAAVLATAAFAVVLACVLAAIVVFERTTERRRRCGVRAIGRARVPYSDPYAGALALARDRGQPWS